MCVDLLNVSNMLFLLTYCLILSSKYINDDLLNVKLTGQTYALFHYMDVNPGFAFLPIKKRCNTVNTQCLI